MQTAQVIAQFGGGILASVLPPAEDIPATVQGKMGKSSSLLSFRDPFSNLLSLLTSHSTVFALTIFYESNSFVGKAIYEDFLPQALASGQIKPMPPAEIVGHGIEKVQEAGQKQKAGVSAKKIVVTL